MVYTVTEINVEMEPVNLRGYPEPPPPYTQIDPANNSTVEQPVARQTIILQPPLKDVPVYFHCPSCHKNGLTAIEYVNSHKTHMVAGFICGLTVWCCLCCIAAIPYWIQRFKKVDHFCSNCNYYLGSYSKL